MSADVVASGPLRGHEARGVARVLSDGTTQTVELAQLWVAPGAPDVRLYASADPSGHVDDSSVEIGRVRDHESLLRWEVAQPIPAAQMQSIVVYCKVFSVHFGHATLDWSA